MSRAYLWIGGHGGGCRVALWRPPWVLSQDEGGWSRSLLQSWRDPLIGGNDEPWIICNMRCPSVRFRQSSWRAVRSGSCLQMGSWPLWSPISRTWDTFLRSLISPTIDVNHRRGGSTVPEASRAQRN